MDRDLGIHSRDELLARVFTELAVLRGWVKDGQTGVDDPPAPDR